MQAKNPRRQVRRYICGFCAKAFSRSEHKTRHERSHTKEKPFCCEVCNTSFVRRDLLQRHLRTVHSRLIQEERDGLDNTRTSEDIVNKHIIVTESSVRRSSVPCTSGFRNLNQNHFITSSWSLNTAASTLLASTPHAESYLLQWINHAHKKLPIVPMETLGALSAESSLFYGLLAMGATDLGKYSQAAQLCQQAWQLVVKEQQQGSCDIHTMLQSLTVLCYSVLRVTSGADHMFDYLEQVLNVMMTNSHQSHFNLWYCFLVLSRHALLYKRPVLQQYPMFLLLELPNGGKTLAQGLDELSLNSWPVESSLSLRHQILIMGLANELEALKHFQDADVFHNAVIMANKSIFTSHSGLDLAGKCSLVMNCPVKLHSIMQNYLVLPQNEYHWLLLDITLREFFSGQNVPLVINNNLGIVALPILFAGFQRSKPQMPLDCQNLIGDTYMLILRMLQIMGKESPYADSYFSSPIFQSIVYLVREKCVPQSAKVESLVQELLSNAQNVVIEDRDVGQFIKWLYNGVLQSLEGWGNDEITKLFAEQEFLTCPQSPLVDQEMSRVSSSSYYTATSAATSAEFEPVKVQQMPSLTASRLQYV